MEMTPMVVNWERPASIQISEDSLRVNGGGNNTNTY